MHFTLNSLKFQSVVFDCKGWVGIYFNNVFYILWNSYPEILNKNGNQEKKYTCYCRINKEIPLFCYRFDNNLVLFDFIYFVVKSGDLIKVFCMVIPSAC